MSPEFENMLYLLGCGALGKEADPGRCVNLRRVRELALSQEVWDIIYAAIREKINAGIIRIPNEIAEKLESTFTANVAKNVQRTAFSREMINTLRRSGIECCLLKGTTVAKLYHTPEVRISSDTDILISPENVRKTKKILEKNGYEVEEYNKHDHHIKAYHPVGGLMEIHIALHSRQTHDIVLDEAVSYNEPFISEEDGIKTLGVNDGLVFLSAHMIKHFINDSAGVRQMMDLLLYMKHYENQIDWTSYNQLINRMRYDKLIAVVKGIGVKYFGMDFEGAEKESSVIAEFLEDSEIGGAFGFGESNRSAFYSLYIKKRSAMSKAKFTAYYYLTREQGILRSFFPDKKTMLQRYKYLEKYPFLIVFSWFQRFFDLLHSYFTKSKVKSGNSSETSKMLQRKLELAKKLEMIGRD